MLENERIQMQSCELESTIMNTSVPEKQINKLILECEEGLILRNTSEARDVINRLVSMVKSLQKDIRMHG